MTVLALAGPAGGPTTWTLILSAAGIIAGALGGWLGYRGQSKSANAEETAAIFAGQRDMITALQAEIKRCHEDNVAVDRKNQSAIDLRDQKIEHLDEVVERLRTEIHDLGSDFQGLLMVVKDEISREAGQMTLRRMERTLEQMRSPDATEGESAQQDDEGPHPAGY